MCCLPFRTYPIILLVRIVTSRSQRTRLESDERTWSNMSPSIPAIVMDWCPSRLTSFRSLSQSVVESSGSCSTRCDLSLDLEETLSKSPTRTGLNPRSCIESAAESAAYRTSADKAQLCNATFGKSPPARTPKTFRFTWSLWQNARSRGQILRIKSPVNLAGKILEKVYKKLARNSPASCV